jgi:hypothetical protein
MAADPVFAATPRNGVGNIATGNTTRDASVTTGIVSILTAGASGTLVTRIDIKATVTTTLGMVRLWIHDGTNYRLWREVPVTAITVSASVAGFEYSITMSDGLILPSGYSLRASTHNSESFNIAAMGGDF